MKYTINSFFLVFLMAIGISLHAQDYNEFNIPLSKPSEKGTLVVDIKNGSVTVKGTPRKDVLVKYRSTESESIKMQDAGNGLKKLSGGLTNLEIYEEDNEVQVESNNWSRGIEVIIEAPQNMNMQLGSYNNGKIIVENVSGELELENYNGPITAKSISGSVVANTYNGDILITFTKITPDTPMSFTTYNGKVDLTLPASTKASVKARSDYGDIYTGFDMTFTKPKPQVQKGSKRLYIDGWVTGTINGGGPEFSMQNYHGDIFIRKQ